MKKKRIYAPGPVFVPTEVLLAGAQEMIHHRAADFDNIFYNCQKKLQYLFQTSGDVVTFASSGTGALEAAITSVMVAGDKCITVEGGKFGQRWTQVATAYGYQPIKVDMEWGNAVDPAVIEKLLKENPDVKAVVCPLTETSTGVVHPIKEIAAITRKSNALLIVDAVSAIAAEPLLMDEWGVDMVGTGSQKAMMLPPGLAFCAVGARARKVIESTKSPNFYFSIKKYLKSLAEKTTPFTPAVSLIFSLNKALDLIIAEGLDNIWARHAHHANAIRAAMEAHGLSAFAKSPSVVCATLNVPDGVDGGGIVKILKNKHGIFIAGGQDHLKGKIFRIATLGAYDLFDVVSVITAVELTLDELGYKITLGKGVGAALQVLRQPAPASPVKTTIQYQ